LVPAYAEKCRAAGIPFETIRAIEGKPWRSWRSIYSALRRLDPDVIVLHSISSLIPAALYCLVSRAHLVAVEHTPLALKTRAERLISLFSFFFAQRIVVLTEEYKDAYLQGAGFFGRPAKVEVIPNGIDVNVYKRVPGGTTLGVFRIGMAARFSAAKRQDVIVLALVFLRQRRPDIRWVLTLAGDGDCLGAVRTLACSSGVAEHVEFTGNLGEPALVAWFQSLDLYVHASDGEALSTSILQAMAMELPVVASDVPGIGNLLSQTLEVGVLVEKNEGRAFARAIEAVQCDPPLRSRLSSAARARVCDGYSCEAMFNAYNAAIRGFTKRHDAR
jgi:glycosyltransferase involved in cell wall biosynthesis